MTLDGQDVVVVVVAAVLGVAVGLGLTAVLSRRGYRRPDERERPGPRTWWVAPVLALGLAALGLAARDEPATLLVLGVALVWMAGLAVIDLDVRRLPDVWTGAGAAGALLALTGLAAASSDWTRWAVALACGLASGAVYLALVLLNPSGLGLGDVKLAVPLGLLTGWWGPAAAIAAFLAAFVLGLLVGLVVAVRTRGGLGSTFPFGPSMLLGAATVLVLAAAAT